MSLVVDEDLEKPFSLVDEDYPYATILIKPVPLVNVPSDKR